MSYGMQGSSRGAAGADLRGSAAGFKEKRPHGYQKASLQLMDPNQIKLFEQMFSHVGPESYLSRLAGGDQGMFEEMEAPAHRMFQQEMGGLASRFSGAGMGARRGSGFQNASTQATQDFSMNLASRRQELQRQAIMDLMGLSNQLLGQRPFEQFYQKKNRENPWGEIAGKFGGAIPGAIASWATGGNPMSGVTGALQGFSQVMGGGGGGGSGGGGYGGNQFVGRNTSGPYNLPTFGGF